LFPLIKELGDVDFVTSHLIAFTLPNQTLYYDQTKQVVGYN